MRGSLEMTSSCHAVPLLDLTSVSEARRAVRQVAERLGLTEVKLGEAAIIATEAARNAVVHGRGGELLVSGVARDHELRLHILALDRGSGIPDLPRAMQDGFSTSSTPGAGLGAIRRLASGFDLFTNTSGTAVLGEIVEGPATPRGGLDVAGFTVPFPGEQVCGDAIHWLYGDDRCIALLVDGLGHGLHAADAAEEAVNVFEKYSSETPKEILARIHDALKKTRGAAAGIAEIRPLSGTLTFAGVGNTSAVVLSKALGRNLISHSGTLGHVLSRIQEFKVEWPKDAILIMHSDGLQTRWDLSRYPGLSARSPGVIAGILFRDFRRERDDASIVVIKNRNASV